MTVAKSQGSLGEIRGRRRRSMREEPEPNLGEVEL